MPAGVAHQPPLNDRPPGKGLGVRAVRPRLREQLKASRIETILNLATG